MLLALVLAVIAISTSPLWLVVLMIKPALLTPLSNLVMQKMTRQMMGMMFARGKTPTVPVKETRLCGESSTGLST